MKRLEKITPFIVMDMLKKARSIPDVSHFEIGEPDMPPSPKVMEAMLNTNNKIGYTESLGLYSLREKIAAYYYERYKVDISPTRVVITTGTSAAFLIAYAILLDAGDKILFSDPAYPCYKNFAYILNLSPVFAAIDQSTNYQLTIKQLQKYQNIKAIQISSPSNPIGNICDNLSELIEYCKNIYFISDEIYHGLVYDKVIHTALEYSDNAIVINGFSKYFCLPGLRLGWMILPENLVRKAEIVIQNLYISAPTLSQYAALAAFDDEYLDVITQTYRERRDYLYKELSQLFTIDIKPEGAFYIWANINNYAKNSLEFSKLLLEQIHVATAPGVDFGNNNTDKYIRFAYTKDLSHLQKGVERLRNFLI